MKKVKCINGHFFDMDNFEVCPICDASCTDYSDFEVLGKIEQSEEVLNKEINITKPMFNFDDEKEKQQKTIEENHSEPMTASVSNQLSNAVAQTQSASISSIPQTSVFYDINETTPPVAWIVGIKGEYTGKAFECKTGKNRIGRNLDFEIVLLEDTSITRDVHAILIYEPNEREFFLQTGASDGLVYLNGKLLFTHEKLKAYDKFSLGKSEFVFVPLCGENFTWDDIVNEGDLTDEYSLQ